MKIIQSCGSPSWGGLEMITLDLTKRLNNRGHDVMLLCRKNSKLHQEAADNKITVLPLLYNNTAILGSIRKLRNFLGSNKANNVDILHTHLSHDLWTLVPALRSSNCTARLFLTKHMGSGVTKKDVFHKSLYKRVDRIFAVSNYIKASVLKTCPVKNEQVTLLPDFVSVRKFNRNLYDKCALLKQYKIPENSIVIGMVGRMTPGKGHEDLIKAAGILDGKTDKSIYYLIAGSASFGEEKYEETVRKMASALPVTNKFVFTGFQSDVARIMALIDILVFPSHLESFGITLLEAMAMELPVIASSNAGIPDIVVDGMTGFLVPPKDPALLSEAMLKLVNSPELRSSFGIAGRKRVEELFDAEINVSRLENYYLNREK